MEVGRGLSPIIVFLLCMTVLPRCGPIKTEKRYPEAYSDHLVHVEIECVGSGDVGSGDVGSGDVGSGDVMSDTPGFFRIYWDDGSEVRTSISPLRGGRFWHGVKRPGIYHIRLERFELDRGNGEYRRARNLIQPKPALVRLVIMDRTRQRFIFRFEKSGGRYLMIAEPAIPGPGPSG